MKLIRSLVIASLLFGAVSCSQTADTKAPASAQTDTKTGARKVEISVTGDGFVPATAHVKVGQPVTLVITRKTERTCATDVVIKDFDINKPLPLNVPVEVTLTPTKPGTIRYACAMDMIAGELVAE